LVKAERLFRRNHFGLFYQTGTSEWWLGHLAVIWHLNHGWYLIKIIDTWSRVNECRIKFWNFRLWFLKKCGGSLVEVANLTPMYTSKNIPLFRYRFGSRDWCYRVINYWKWKYRPECSTWMRNIFLSLNGVGVIIKTNFVYVPQRDVCVHGS